MVPSESRRKLSCQVVSNISSDTAGVTEGTEETEGAGNPQGAAFPPSTFEESPWPSPKADQESFVTIALFGGAATRFGLGEVRLGQARLRWVRLG